MKKLDGETELLKTTERDELFVKSVGDMYEVGNLDDEVVTWSVTDSFIIGTVDNVALIDECVLFECESSNIVIPKTSVVFVMSLSWVVLISVSLIIRFVVEIVKFSKYLFVEFVSSFIKSDAKICSFSEEFVVNPLWSVVVAGSGYEKGVKVVLKSMSEKPVVLVFDVLVKSKKSGSVTGNELERVEYNVEVSKLVDLWERKVKIQRNNIF